MSVLKEAFQAWSHGGCSDEQLRLCIHALKSTIHTMEALDSGSIIMTGLYLQLHSMEISMGHRERMKVC